ncbi:MAG TPA: glycine oxidase ThiO [Pyrinomonadaceae bacterium]|jgi:glycine oxidase|nr:glycine oxidase ThiO [Pyrinomonadaceae bacterium]
MSEFKNSTEVAIIGGGVIGMAIARALAQRGVRDVLIVERSSLGAEASSAAAGMLAPQAEADSADEFFQLCCQSRDLYPAFAQTLREETGIDIELETTGTLYLAFTEEDERELKQRYDWQTSAGLEVENLSPGSARLFEPGISPNLRAALRFPLDNQVENRRLISALANANEALGVRVLTGASVDSLSIKRDRVSGIETSRGFITCEKVVIASGAWTNQVISEVLPNPRVEPVRGQMVSFDATLRIARHVIYSSRGYIVPRRDGRLLAGSTTEHAGFDKRVTAAGVQAIVASAVEIAPAVAALPLASTWAGLRPRAADGLPVLGPCAEIAGVFYATGHYRNGILLTPITADLLASAIVDDEVSPPLQIFSPDRFQLVSIR